MNADDILRPILLRHLDAVRASWETGHAILVYYVVNMARYYNVEMDIPDIRGPVEHKRPDDIEFFTLEDSELKWFDDDGNTIPRPFDALRSANIRFKNHLRMLIVYIADHHDPDKVIPWRWGSGEFDATQCFLELRRHFRSLGKMNWSKAEWQSNFQPMTVNADAWRQWFKWAGDEIMNANQPDSEMPLPPIEGDWSAPRSPAQWASDFDCSWKTLKRRIGEGKIRAIKLSSKSYRIHVDDLPDK